MNIRKQLAAVLFLVFTATVVSAQAVPRPEMRLRLVPLLEGVSNNKNVAELAGKYGVNLKRPKHPLIAHNIDDRGRLFILFYNQIDNALGDQPYLIQRVKKIEKFYDLEGKQRPIHTKYLVEAFKTNAGSIKGIDEHYGGYSMGKNSRREIVKELEVGYGRIPDVCEGKTWPFDDGKLYEEIQDYSTKEAIFNAVEFERSIKWTIRIGFTAKGQYRIKVPELKIDLPKKTPPKEMAIPWKDPSSKNVVLTAGKGCNGIVLGKSSGRDIEKALGRPLEVVRITDSDVNYSYSKGLTVQVEANNEISTLFTRPSFAGRTKKGIRLGDSKSKVRKAYGRPKGKPDEWQYPGIVFRFDESERVKSIFVFGRR